MKLKIIGLFAIIIVVVASVFSSVKTGKLAGVGEGIKHTGIMCYQVNDNPDTCQYNAYVSWGKNVTRDLLMGSNSSVRYISVSNGTGVTSANNITGQINECGVTWYKLGTLTVQEVSDGNYSAQAQYSVTCNVPVVNNTGIFNSTDFDNQASLFAAANFSSEVTNLASGDTLTVTWYIWST